LATAAYGPDGVRRGGKRQKIPVNLNFPGFGKTVGFELLSRLELPPGRYQLRLAVETSVEGARVSDRSPKVALFGIGEDLSSKTGSIYCDVDVPDFQNERLAMSGVALMTSPPTPSGPPRALANVLPVIPTTLRDFMTTDAVDGFVRVSQGGTEVLEPVTITLRIVDARGTTVAEQTEELSQSVFSRDRTADYRFALPLAGLSRGQYLLTVASRAARASAKREVRFTIHK
jgi:hypothetical protein